MSKALSLLALVGLTACSSSPVEFLGEYAVEYQNSRMIIIRYNSKFGSYETVYNSAIEHCSQFGKAAVLNESAIPQESEIKKHMFYCTVRK